jgi:glucosyl-dolichyl phosphate glucuronosyltransferase
MMISLIVPTYNRADTLEAALNTFVRQTLDSRFYEIIVIDNNSTDGTKLVCDKLFRANPDHNLRYHFEPRQGLHYARNRGIVSARGEIAVFGDDDIEAAPQWLESIKNSFEKDRHIGIVGGPIYPIWDGRPPMWIYDYGGEKKHGVFACLNYGEESKYIENEELFGCNFAIRRDIAVEIGGSGPDTFPPDMIHFSGTGEGGMLKRTRQKGFKVYYDAKASVKHRASVSRCTLGYFVSRYRRWAVESIYHQYNRGDHLSEIFTRLVWRSIVVFFSLLRTLVVGGKANMKYFIIVRSSHILFSWKHFLKLISDSSLRGYTREQDHLKGWTT